ncbi:hypothetical protein BD779DRAFT_1537208 [Infundibulicybe gibba]|nr:hypothetical protein BD779DRAFT_1537208 [Infundibulicybe gibba]
MNWNREYKYESNTPEVLTLDCEQMTSFDRTIRALEALADLGFVPENWPIELHSLGSHEIGVGSIGGA